MNIGENVASIDFMAFFDTEFEEITVYALSSPVISEPLSAFDEYAHNNVKLFVPNESILDYKSAFDWKSFSYIKGIGCVDATGIVLDAESAVLNAGETMTLTATVAPEDATDKSVIWASSDESVATVADGVVTGLKPGTSTITAATVNGLIATCEVTVCLLGDVNGDGVVNVADVVATTNYIAGNEVLNFNAVMADINGDGDITVSDAVLIAQIILDADARSTDVMSRSRVADMSADCLEVLDNGSSVELSLSSDGYSAFQADVVLPAGVEFAWARLGDGAESTHTVMTAVKEGNMVRLVVFSLANADFKGTVELQLTGTRHDDESVEVCNAVASDAAGRSRSIGADVNKGIAGIYDINAQGNIGIEPIAGGVELTGAEGMRYSIYTTTGVSVATREAVSDRETVELPAGIYIVTIGSKTRKVVVR